MIKVKKIFILSMVLFCFVSFSNVKADDVNPAAYGIETSEEWIFTKRSLYSESYASVADNVNYWIGKVTTDAFLFKLSDEINTSTTYDYYLVAYKVSVLPLVSKKKYNWFNNFYGWSECLNVSADYSNGEKITNYSPVTENPEISYSVGLSMGLSGKSVEAGLSLGMCTTESALKITANNDSSNRKLKIKYDYLCDILHSKSYLTNETIQYGMFIVEVKKNSYYSVRLNVDMAFNPASGWSNFIQVNTNNNSKCHAGGKYVF